MTRADGAPCHLLDALGHGFELLYVGNGARPAPPDGIAMVVVGKDLIDTTGRFTERFDAQPGSAYLLRPDQHLCARWRSFDADKVRMARLRALGH
jgi:3-(3-hydroxy-phenyl)propionate hydroxylase